MSVRAGSIARSTGEDVHQSSWQPNQKRRSNRRTPLLTWAAFKKAHEESYLKLLRYLGRGHRGPFRLSTGELAELNPRVAKLLLANNTFARMRFAQVFVRHLNRCLAALPRNAPIFWITLVSSQFAFSESDAKAFDHQVVQDWARSALPECSLLGMTEASIYTNVGTGVTGEITISWHVHLIAWGVTEVVLSECLDAVNQDTGTLVSGLAAADYSLVRADQATGKAWYMLKAPQSEHRVYPEKETWMDKTTGVITVRTTGRFWQRKQPLTRQPGHMVRLYHVLAGRQLDQLAFATGEGEDVLRAVTAEALSDVPRARPHTAQSPWIRWRRRADFA